VAQAHAVEPVELISPIGLMVTRRDSMSSVQAGEIGGCGLQTCWYCARVRHPRSVSVVLAPRTCRCPGQCGAVRTSRVAAIEPHGWLAWATKLMMLSSVRT
jgi:hypothetical protein